MLYWMIGADLFEAIPFNPSRLSAHRDSVRDSVTRWQVRKRSLPFQWEQRIDAGHAPSSVLVRYP